MKIKSILKFFSLTLLFSIFLTSCNSSKSAFNGEKGNYKNNVVASYYHKKFNGRRTASGEKFHNSRLTAAHKTLPFGTIVRVTNKKNKKSVKVKINDRGPFVKGREIDLSKKAFMRITDNKDHGLLNVDIKILKK